MLSAAINGLNIVFLNGLKFCGHVHHVFGYSKDCINAINAKPVSASWVFFKLKQKLVLN